MKKVSESSLTSVSDRVSHVVAPASATNSTEEKTTMTNKKAVPTTNLELAVEWSLAHDVEYPAGRSSSGPAGWRRS